jgi:transposase
MRNVREVLRLSLGEGLSVRQVSQSLGMSRPTVQRYVARALAAGVSWPLPADVDDTRLAGLLFRRPECSPEMVGPLPDWGLMHHELRHKGVTLQLLWMEYKQRHPDDGYQYTQFCDHYHRWARRLDLVMRHDYRPARSSSSTSPAPPCPSSTL